MFLCPSKTPFE